MTDLPLERTCFLTCIAADMVQDLFVKAINGYKPTPKKPSDAEGQVQKFSMPSAPASPEESNIANQLKEYEDQQVDVEAAASEGGAAIQEGENMFEDDLEDEEENEKSGH